MDITSIDKPLAAPSVDGAVAMLPDTDSLPDLNVRFGYRIGSFSFVLDKYLLTEIVVRPRIYSLPHNPNWLCGVLNLRGNIITVLDLSSALGTICHGTPGQYILVVDKGRDALGLVVDSPPRTLNNPQPLFSKTSLSDVTTDFVQAGSGVHADNTSWHLLDVKGLALSLGAAS